MPVDLVVVGLGYVGLPLVASATSVGLSVVGLDSSPAAVNGLNAGVSHVDDLADADVASLLEAGFRATTDASVLAEADVAVICVPTPLSPDGGPDLTAINSAAADVAAHLHSGMLVVLESTTWPGTTEEVLRPLLEAGGLRAGLDFHLAFSPERIDPGNARFGLRNTPKVVGGVTEACTQRAAAFYEKFIDTVVTTRGTREAEMAKLLENTYRHVNIALVNEMAKFCHELDIDLWDVIGAAATKPFGFQAFYPGPGVGGHCIPIDPNYLSHRVRSRLGYPFRFVELAQEINAGMPAYIVNRAMRTLNRQGKALNGARVLLVGVTYKPDISDQRESPAKPIAHHLRELGAVLTYADPHVDTWTVGGISVPRAGRLRDAANFADLVIVLQHHRDADLDVLLSTSVPVLDTRGALHGGLVERL